jgi:hypothetical protein
VPPGPYTELGVLSRQEVSVSQADVVYEAYLAILREVVEVSDGGGGRDGRQL